jgi:HK97 family phage portal protein
LKLFGFNISREKRSSLVNPSDKLKGALGGLPLLSGVKLNEDNALQISTVYACVRILAESVAQLPLKVYRRTATGSEEATEHPAFRLLKSEPNQFQTSFEFREMMQGQVSLRGNAYAYIERDAAFQPVALIPLDPASVEVYKGDRSKRFKYKGRWMERWEVLHIAGLSSDGFVGLSPVALMRETMGVAKALEMATGSLLGNGVRTSGVLEHPAELSDEAAKRLREQFDDLYAGAAKNGKTVVLEEGMKWHQVGMTFEDAQVLESKKFSVEEICRIYRIPLHMVQSTEKSTSWGSGIEQLSLGFVHFSLQPWLTRWEQAMDVVLLREDEKLTHFTKYDLRALLRGDHKTRMEAYATGLLNGIYSINEVRAFEEMNELPDNIGGVHRVPLNTVAAGTEPAAPRADPQPIDTE